MRNGKHFPTPPHLGTSCPPKFRKFLLSPLEPCPSFVFLGIACFSPARNSLAFERFSLLFQGFYGLVGIKNPCFWWFSLPFSKKQGRTGKSPEFPSGDLLKSRVRRCLQKWLPRGHPRTRSVSRRSSSKIAGLTSRCPVLPFLLSVA